MIFSFIITIGATTFGGGLYLSIIIFIETFDWPVSEGVSQSAMVVASRSSRVERKDSKEKKTK